MSKKAVDALFLAGMIVSWSIYYAASKICVQATGSAFFTTFIIRFFVMIFLAVLIVKTGEIKNLFSYGKRTWLLVLIGILGFAQDICANLGYAGGNLSTGTALLKSDVLMAEIVSVIVYKKRLYLIDYLATALMLMGVFLVMGINFSDMSFNAGDIFFILSAAALTANAFAVKAAQNVCHVNEDSISSYNNFIVMLLSFIGASATGAVRPESVPGTPLFWLLVILGALAQTVIFYCYYRYLKSHEVWLVKLYLLLIPVLSCFIGVFFLGEQLTALKIAGIFTVLTGAAVILLRDKFIRKGVDAS